MKHGCWLVCFSLLAMAAAVFSAHVQPVSESEVAEMPERLRELLLVRKLINSLNTAEALSDLQGRPAQGIRPYYSLEEELALLSKAAAADLDFRNLRVSRRSIRSFCSTNSDRQCRNFCFNLGDSACADGDLGGNGEDSKFLSGGLNPGK